MGNTDIYFERPFEYLRRKTNNNGDEGAKFGDQIVKNWYRARIFVLNKLGNFALRPDDQAHLQVIVTSDSNAMLAIVRQVALIAHYINYDEEKEDEKNRRRTVITIVSQKKGDSILSELRKEENLYHLIDYCKYTVFDAEPVNPNSFIDIEIQILKQCPVVDKNNPNVFVFTESEVEEVELNEENTRIDTRKAQYADKMYNLGSEINNIPFEDIHNVDRYSLALSVFQNKVLKKERPKKMVVHEQWEPAQNQIKVLLNLSNILCADCFEIRDHSIRLCCPEGKMKKKDIKKLWESNHIQLCLSEHARWNVEKLILGYRPLSFEERSQYEKLQGDERKKYAKALKNNWKSPAHIDLCSNADLRRIDPDNMKYDSFLMLGIPQILKKVRKK